MKLDKKVNEAKMFTKVQNDVKRGACQRRFLCTSLAWISFDDLIKE
jgi:hypothetical protein